MMILETKVNQVARTATSAEPTMHEGTITILGSQDEVELYVNYVIDAFKEIDNVLNIFKEKDGE